MTIKLSDSHHPLLIRKIVGTLKISEVFMIEDNGLSYLPNLSIYHI